jgi:hypothetical protein
MNESSEGNGNSTISIRDVTIVAVLTVALVAGIVPSMCQSDARCSMVAGEVVVAFEDVKISPQVNSISSWNDAHIIDRNDALNCVLVRTNDEAALISHISNSTSARYAEPNRVIRALYSPNDPFYSTQWGPGQINTDKAWDVENGDKNITIAIIDTGVDYTHEDLSDNYVSGGHDWVNNDSDPMDDNGHGTHCAGIAAATMDNGKGIAGIAQVNILAEKVLHSDGWGTDWDVAQAITHAADNGVNIISMSLGDESYSRILNDACQYGWDNGCLIVAASGNEYDRGVSHPAACDTVIAVGATDMTNQRCAFSNWGPELELVAPGNGILSCVPPNEYMLSSGTSMAAPHVAGVAALIWSMYPGFTNQGIRDRLNQTASDLGTYGWDEYYGWGLVDAEAALGSGEPFLEANWTFIVYLAADNNLNMAGIDDLNEMEVAGSTTDISIVVLMDRSGDGDSAIYHVTHDVNPFILSSPIVRDLGEVNMGDPDTLIDFVTWTMQNYPARHHALVLWDHGNGWREEIVPKDITPSGICVDDTSGYDYITSPELRYALSTINAETGIVLDIVGFDACLMGMEEIDYQMMHYVNFRVGSEEAVPWGGLPYDAILVALRDDSAMTPEVLVSRMVSDYMDSHGTGGDETLSAVELYDNDVALHANDLAQSIIAGCNRVEIASARSLVESYYDPDYVDLYHCAELVRTHASDAAVKSDAQEVMDEIDRVVVAEEHGTGHPDSHGISIYFPETEANYWPDYETELDFTADTEWDEFLNWYYDDTTETPDIWIDPTNIEKELPPDTIWNGSLTIGNDGIGALDFEIQVVVLHAIDEVNTLDEAPHPIMHPDVETLGKWIESYNAAPRMNIAKDGLTAPARGGSHSVLHHLDYVPCDRNQGSCGNCWVWAGTGCMEVSLDVENGVRDRLSVQYLNSNYSGGTGSGYACCGGWLESFADFYSMTTAFAIPWDNTNAGWQDGGTCCCEYDWCLPPNDETTVSTASISTTPHYTITRMDTVTIATQINDDDTAIANIKSVLDGDNAVWFGFFLPGDIAWNDFSDFWDYQPETAVWNPDNYCGPHYIGTGGGHAVLCVGYNDTSPEDAYWVMLNSWGTTAQRPNGLFRMKMDIDYDCYFEYGLFQRDYSLYWQMLDVDFEIPEPPQNTPPTACFTASPSSGDMSTIFGFDASCSSDAHDPISSLRVRWDWENDGVYDTPYAFVKTATHQFTSAGSKTIKLQVVDTSGSNDTTTRSVIVSDADYLEWLSASPTTGTVNPGDYMNIDVIFNTTGLDPGSYHAEVIIENNDRDEDPAIVPVELTVVDGVCGDVNGDGDIGIVDAMFIAQYTVGNRPASNLNMHNADVNACDGDVDIVDAMFIAQYTVGTRTTLECCQPHPLTRETESLSLYLHIVENKVTERTTVCSS